MTSRPSLGALPAGALTVLVALLATSGLAAAHEPNTPAPDWQTRLQVDQNDDYQSLGAGHDLVVLDVEEVWVPERQDARIVFRLVVDAVSATIDPNGPFWESFNVTIDGKTYKPTFSTTNNQESTFQAQGWDYLGKKVPETDLYGPNATGHGDWSVKLGLDYRTLNLTLDDVTSRVVNVSAFQTVSWRSDEKRDLMVGGSWNDPNPLTGDQDFTNTSQAEQNAPISVHNLPYRLRGPARWTDLAASTAAVQVAPGASTTFNLTLTNRLTSTNQSMDLAALDVPAGWNVTFAKGPHTVCAVEFGSCDVVVQVNVTALDAATEGVLRMEVLGRFDHLDGFTRDVVPIALTLPPAAGTPLTISDLVVQPGVTGASVRWNTSVPASAEVRYGLTDSYGSNATRAQLAPTHALALTGLEPATTYHYQVVATNGSASAESQDGTFTTLPRPTVAFLTPQDGETVQGSVRVALRVTDWTGPVRLLVDGTRVATLEAPYNTTLPSSVVEDGEHVLRAEIEDHASATVNVTVANDAGDPGVLLEGIVTPADGTIDTEFTFSVVYRDADGDGATRAQVFVDGKGYDMTRGDGAPEDGVTYTHRLSDLAPGEHSFVFRFTTAQGSLRLPAEGSFPGPKVTATTGGGDGNGGTGDGGSGGSGDGGTGDGGSGNGDGGSGDGDGGTGAGSGDGGTGGAGAPPPEDRGLPGPAVGLAALAVAAAAVMRGRGPGPSPAHGDAGRKAAWAAALAMLLLAAALFAATMPAIAHQTQRQGDVGVIVGWAHEPPIVDDRNAIEIKVSERGEGVDGLSSLRAWVRMGPEELALELSPRHGSPGVYEGELIPSRQGRYDVRVVGTVGDETLDMLFDEVEPVQPRSDLAFPAQGDGGGTPGEGAASAEEVAALKATVTALEARVAALESQLAEGGGTGSGQGPDRAATPGPAAPLGVLALLGGALAMAHRMPRRGARRP